jgi:C-terminal processing protease CtpA/Prc
MVPVARMLADFRSEHEAEQRLTADDKHAIVAAAKNLIGDYYVHLPLKRAMHGIDPLRSLRILDGRVTSEDLTDRAFHDEMLSIFADLQDRHTTYYVPAPYRDLSAALPFRVQLVDRDTAPRYLVTATTPDWLTEAPTDGAPFDAGVEVLAFNGVAIDRAVRANARWQAGTHLDAQLARGVLRLTDRALTYSPLPDEDWVLVDYQDDAGVVGSIRTCWRVYQADEAGHGQPRQAGPAAFRLGLDHQTEAVRRAQKTRFRPGAMELERAPESVDPPPGQASTHLPDNLQYFPLPREGKSYGHLRIRTFKLDSTTALLVEIRNLLKDHDPADGLIIDVRGNGGGDIVAAERLLQFFTPHRIQPGGVQFLATAGTEKVAQKAPFDPWAPSLARSLRLGEEMSDALPFEPGHVASCNDVGQLYYGPVVLIVDALSYSATDAFAAGFADHGIGTVIGVDAATGGGGGNPWNVDNVAAVSGVAFPLPEGVSFDVAVRRNLRVGRRSGTPVEELGVACDVQHALTRRDVMSDNEDLIEVAIAQLALHPAYRMKATVAFDGGVAAVDVTTRGLDSLDIYLDGRPARPRESIADGAGAASLQVPAAEKDSHLLELFGYADDQLVASRAEHFGTGPATRIGAHVGPINPSFDDSRRER